MITLLSLIAIACAIIAFLYLMHLLVIAWRVNIIWFLICALVPFGIYPFSFMNWDVAKKSFIKLHVLGVTAFILLHIISYLLEAKGK